MFKRIIASVLAMMLLFTAVPVETLAAEPVEQASVDFGNVSVEGANSFGNLLSQEITENQAEAAEEAEAYEAGYAVTDLVIEGATATVTYDSMEDALLLVALYTEDGMQMLTSTTAFAASDATEAVATFSGEMPEYFLASAYLVDSYDLSPLCATYDTPLYTREMQELLASTVDDYDEDLVLNLDGDDTTNFAVYADTTKIIEASDGINTVVSADDETYTYVIANADERITGLLPGDIFAYPYGENEILIVKVASVEIDGTTATITGADMEIGEAFSHMKIESTGGTEDIIVDEDAAGDGVSFDGIQSHNADPHSLQPNGSIDEDIEYEKSLCFTLEKELGKTGSIEGTLGVDLNIEFQYYVTASRQFIELRIDHALRAAIEVEGSASLVRIPLFPMKLMPIPALGIGFEPAFVVDFKVTAEIEFKWYSTIGLSFDSGLGFKDLCRAPVISMDSTVEGRVLIGFDLAPTIDLVEGAIAEIKLTAMAGLTIRGEMTGYGYEEEILGPPADDDSIHDCERCLRISLSVTGELEAAVTFLRFFEYKEELTEKSWDVGMLYYSFDKKELGWGACPYWKYLITAEVLRETGDPCPDAELSVDGVCYSMNADGLAQFYLSEATHVFEATDGSMTSKRTVRIDGPQKVQIQLGMQYPDGASVNLFGSIQPEDITDYGYVIDSGACGTEGDRQDNVKWALYSGGVLKLYGSGKMRDYEPFTLLYVPWYNNRHAIKKVVVEGIENIGSLAFYDAPNIQSVQISNSVKEIGWFAFGFNSGLKTVELGTGITTIESEAFAACYNMTSVTIPGSHLTSVGGNAFNDCGSLEAVYIEDLGNWCNVEFETLQSNPLFYAGNLYLNGEPVTEVTYPAGSPVVYGATFANCNTLTTVRLPAGIEAIGPYAFYGCENLTDINFPDTIVRIQYEAFRGCTGLSGTIRLPWSLMDIGGNAFYGCTGITGVIIPYGVTEISKGAFRGCTSLLTVDLPSGVTRICSYAFCECRSLTSITIPDRIEKIEDDAFSQCTSLKEVHISSLEKWCRLVFDSPWGNPLYLGAGLYLDGVPATDITIPAGITSIGAYTFYKCSSLTSVTIPDTVTQIGKDAFSQCSALTTVTIGDGTTEIGNGAFSGCNALRDLVIGNSVTQIGDSAFFNCNGMTSLLIPDSVTHIGHSAFKYCQGLTDVVIGHGVTSIGPEAFRSCPSLTSLTLGGSVASIGTAAFFECEALHHVYIQDVESWCQIEFANYSSLPTCNGANLYVDGVLAEKITLPDHLSGVNDNAFYNCVSLTEVTIPDGADYIGDSAFYGCSNLKSIVIPDSVTSIGAYAFYYCSNLSDITLPSGITAIEADTFFSCQKLAALEIPDGAASIGDYAFAYCTSLTRIALPDGVTSLGYNAFDSCSSLTSVTIPDSVTEMMPFVFNGCNGLTSAGPVGTGCNIEFGWTDSIPDYAFHDCRSLSSVTIPEGITRIGSSSFSRTQITGIDIPDGVAIIADNAFYGCKKLSSIALPDSVTGIGAYAFGSCYGLKTIVIPQNVTHLGSFLFNDCSSLTSVTFEGSAPVFEDELVFYSITATCFYPAGNMTWTADVLRDYGGTITWVPYTLDSNGNIIPDMSAAVELLPRKNELAAAVNSAPRKESLPAGSADHTVAPEAVFGGEYTGEQSDGHILKTASFSGLVPQAQYLLLVLKSMETDDPLSSDNLLFIDQGIALEDGTLSFRYIQRETTDISYVVACGASDRNLNDAEITFPEMTAVNKLQAVDPTVVYDGETLIEGLDYVIVGSVAYTEAGTYTCYIRGIRNYAGLVECAYTVTASSTVYGDANGDGRVNSLDVILLRQYLADWDVEPDLTAADANGDGRINSLDVILLRQYLADWDVTLGPQ